MNWKDRNCAGPFVADGSPPLAAETAYGKHLRPGDPPERRKCSMRSFKMELLEKILRSTRSWPSWARSLSTTGLVVFSLLVRLAIGYGLEGYAFLLFFPAIMVSALLFDRGDGIFATVLSGIFVAYFLIPPLYTFSLKSSYDLVALGLFTIVGLLMAILIESLHITVGKLEESRANAEASAQERAVLLSELTHRMRNHLATISSLLRLQARSTEEPSAKAALMTAAHRVNVLARVHERLAIVGGGAVVDSQIFIGHLCDDLKQGLIGLRPVAIELSAESHTIKLQKAVAIGLIINELLTNALKYAFPNDQRGTVRVSFSRHGSEYRLTISDNGVGMGRLGNGSGMGIELVRALASQSGGDVEVSDAHPGSQFVVTLPVQPKSLRIG